MDDYLNGRVPDLYLNDIDLVFLFCLGLGTKIDDFGERVEFCASNFTGMLDL